MDDEWILKLRQYDRYKNYLKYLNVCSGVWPDYKGQPWVVQIFFRFFSLFASAIAFYGMIMYDFTEAASLDTFTRGLGLLVAYFSTFVKVSHLTW